MNNFKFIVITPARNEAKYIGKTIKSVISQTVLPCQWMIVDDGSTDETSTIARSAASVNPWIKVIKRENRGYRDLVSGPVESFYDGLKHISTKDYELIINIDADIVLGKNYFKVILKKFADNPKLGVGCGEVYENDRLAKLRALPLGTNGAAQCLRRSCFQEIGGLVKAQCWDGIACFKAMRLGWQTITFEDEDLRVIHLRPEGSSVINRYHGWARHGRGLHFAGAHPLWVLASAFYHLASRPYVLGSLCLLIGFLEAWLGGAKRYEDQELRQYVRAWQRKKLAQSLKLA